MKITPPEGFQQTRPEKVNSQKDAPGSSSFDSVMRETLEKKDIGSTVKKSYQLSEPRSIQTFGEPRFQPGYIDRTSRVIDLMDSYAKSLSNPRKTLKDIEPELMMFVDEAQSLHEEYIKSGNTNRELKNIMEDLMRAARLESARFNRGDYLDSE